MENEGHIESSANGRPNIGIVALPTGSAGIPPLLDLINVLSPLSASIYLITGRDGYDRLKDDLKLTVVGLDHTSGDNVFSRVLKYFMLQIRTSLAILKWSDRVDQWIFFFSSSLVIPVATAKVTGKRSINSLCGWVTSELVHKNDRMAHVWDRLMWLDLSMYDKIVVYSPVLIKTWGLESCKDRVAVAHHHYINSEVFHEGTNVGNREMLIGYVGRLSEEKGVLEIAKAITLLKDRPQLRFILVGDGDLYQKVVEILDEGGVRERTTLTGWVRNDQISEYLNRMKLLVLPSYTEGLPRIVLEAMACGTPVLSTLVGALPDIIVDGKTGFVMEDNRPETIANNVVRALENPELNGIAMNAKRLVETQYSFERAVEGYRNVINEPAHRA